MVNTTYLWLERILGYVTSPSSIPVDEKARIPCSPSEREKKHGNLVDSASSHTLVSKIKPCMSKYKSSTLKLRMAHYISYSLFDSPLLLG